jgi:7-keto-8-aminopelargonate synthetase-like enzyme
LPTLRQLGVPCQSAGHAGLGHLERRARALAAHHRRVFFLSDGVSMHGSILHVEALRGVLDRVPALSAYIDDAHGVGWSGRFGAGTVLGGGKGLHERMIVVMGLSQAFAACGGAVVFPSAELAEHVLFSGNTRLSSSPLQPAQLGACAASALLHLSAELPPLQERLRERIAAFDDQAAREGVDVMSLDATPIRMVPVGDEERTVRLAARLLADGHLVNVAVFPAVPLGRAAVRIMLNNHHTLLDVRLLVDAIARAMRTRHARS